MSNSFRPSRFLGAGAAAVLASTLFFQPAPASADKGNTLKTAAVGLGILGAVLASKDKPVEGVAAAAGAYILYKQGRDAERQDRCDDDRGRWNGGYGRDDRDRRDWDNRDRDRREREDRDRREREARERRDREDRERRDRDRNRDNRYGNDWDRDNRNGNDRNRDDRNWNDRNRDDRGRDQSWDGTRYGYDVRPTR